MEDARGKESTMQSQSKKELDERKSDATADETLSDIEEREKTSDSTSPDQDPGPSPDGALDESDEKNDAGPM